jgi:uncharacterized protein (DUF1015 family)
MPEFLPFAGLRPDPSLAGPLDGLVCPPYDVITGEQRQVLLDRNPYNVVRLELPNGDYAGAARLLGEWKANGVLAREDAPALYGYRMTSRTPDGQARHTLGVMGALVLEPPGQGILPHEHTTPKARGDRLELIRATRCNTSPIWCLCSEAGLADALGPVPGGDGPARPARAVDDDGNLHEIWPIFDPAAHQSVAAVVAARPLLVADGHHRYETALAYQAERDGEHQSERNGEPHQSGHQTGHRGQAAGAGGPGRAGYDAVLCYVVELAEEHLQVLAIHRVVSGLPAGTDVLGALAPGFELEQTPAQGAALPARMASAGALAVVTRDATYLAVPRLEVPGGGPDLDSSQADAAVRVLPAHQLHYEHDVPAAMAAIRSGAADFAILCRPAPVAQIARTAHGGVRMPPKTTFFWPKPRTGMVLRDFEG